MHSLFFSLGIHFLVIGQPTSTTHLGGVSPCSPAQGTIRPYEEKRDGKKYVEGSMLDRQRHGRWIFLWPSGKKKEQVFYCNGLLHQRAQYWYETGMPALDGRFNLGKPVGSWRYWNQKGQMQSFTPAPAEHAGQFFLNEGNRALLSNQVPKAIFLLQQAFQFSSQNPDIHRSLGVAYARHKKGAKAAFHYRQYLQLNPGAPDRDRIQAVLRQFNNQKAAKTSPSASRPSKERLTFQLSKSTSSSDLSTTVQQSGADFFRQGQAAYKRKEYLEAAKLFDRAYQADNTMHVAIYRKALALRKIKAYQSAIQAYDLFVQKEPTDPDGIYGLAETHRLSGNKAMARQYFIMYLKLENRQSEQKYIDRAKRYLHETQ